MTEAIKKSVRSPASEIDKAFAHFASYLSKFAGSSTAFAIAFLSILFWGLSGPYLHFSTTWQMIVNTGTTIATFLMVFIIQNSQNRDGLALQIKLDEIIRAIGSAKNEMIDLEGLSHNELEDLKHEFAELGDKARRGEFVED
jgi:low affinity Fe/Cu permease